MRRQSWFSWLYRVAGVLRTIGWTAALYLVASPWRDLGGLISERLRWFGWFALYSCVVLGFALGDYIRDACPPGSSRHDLRLTRRMLAFPATLTAVWLVVLQAFGERDVASVVFTAFLAYWAGTDVALGAMPLMEGRLRGSDPAPDETKGEPVSTPPWES